MPRAAHITPNERQPMTESPLYNAPKKAHELRMKKARKTNRLFIVVSDVEKSELQTKAASMGLSISSWVRMVMLKAARGK